MIRSAFSTSVSLEMTLAPRGDVGEPIFSRATYSAGCTSCLDARM